MSANPLDSGFQAGPQSPFQAAPVAPLFVRDRYGSADSVSTVGEVESKPKPSQDESINPWAGEASTLPEREKPAEPELPPADHGAKAWSILAGAFVFEALIWGFPLSYGVFQNHYFNSPGPFKDSPYLPFVGITSTGIFFLGAPLMTYLTETLPRYRRQMIWAGWPLCILSLLAGSFATTIPALIATQGIMYSLGELVLYLPLMSIINEWFLERRGLAYGIVTCSTGVTGIGLPFLTSLLLDKLGHVITLRIFALILAVVTGPMLLLLKPRLPASSLPTTSSLSLSFLRTPLFYLYSATNTLHSLALFLPSIFLPQYATSLSPSQPGYIGALLLALLAVGQVLGQLTFGILSDRSACRSPSSHSRIRIPLNLLLLLTSLPASILAFTAWGLATSLPPLLVFALGFGFFANGQTPLWARMGAVLSPTEPSGVLATFGLFSFQKGLGILIAGPASSALVGAGMHSAVAETLGAYGADGEFAGVVLLTGAGMLGASLLVGTWYVVPRRWRELHLAFPSAGSKAEDAGSAAESGSGGRGWRAGWKWFPWRRNADRDAAAGTSEGGKRAVEVGEERWNEKVRLEEEEAVRQWREAVQVKDEENAGEGGRGGMMSRHDSNESAADAQGMKERGWVGSVDSDAAGAPEGAVVRGVDEVLSAGSSGAAAGRRR